MFEARSKLRQCWRFRNVRSMHRLQTRAMCAIPRSTGCVPALSICCKYVAYPLACVLMTLLWQTQTALMRLADLSAAPWQRLCSSVESDNTGAANSWMSATGTSSQTQLQSRVWFSWSLLLKPVNRRFNSSHWFVNALSLASVNCCFARSINSCVRLSSRLALSKRARIDCASRCGESASLAQSASLPVSVNSGELLFATLSVSHCLCCCQCCDGPAIRTATAVQACADNRQGANSLCRIPVSVASICADSAVLGRADRRLLSLRLVVESRHR